MSRAVLLPWSGGMDSTTLLIQHLIEQKYDHVYTCYIELVGNVEKTVCERNAITGLTNLIQGSVWGPESTVRWTHTEYEFDYPPCHSEEGMFQPIVWLTYAAFYAGSIAEEHDEVDVNIGYVRGDYSLKEKDKVMAAWNGISGLSRMEAEPYPLTFPLKGMTKRAIHRRLQKYSDQYDRPFLDTPWVCENPSMIADKSINGYERCGECGPCSRDPRFK